MNWKEIEDHIEKLENGLSRIFDVVAKVSVDTKHSESGGQSWDVKNPRVVLIEKMETAVIAAIEGFAKSVSGPEGWIWQGLYRTIHEIAERLKEEQE